MLGGYEWIIVLVAIVLLLFGANKIPEFVRSLGMSVSEFKRGRMMVDQEIEEEMRQNRRKVGKKKKKKTKKLKAKKTDEIDERIKLVKRAKALDIPTKGKPNEQLQKDIDEALA